MRDDKQVGKVMLLSKLSDLPSRPVNTLGKLADGFAIGGRVLGGCLPKFGERIGLAVEQCFTRFAFPITKVKLSQVVQNQQRHMVSFGNMLGKLLAALQI